VWAAQRDASGTWTPPKQIDGAPTGGTLIEPLPVLAVSANGTAVVVFQEHTDDTTNGASNAAYAVYSQGSGWAPAGQFTPPTKPNQVNDNEKPQVAIDSQGNAVAVWAQDMGGANDAGAPADFGPQIYTARLTAGQGWSTPTRLSNYGMSGFSGTPHVGVDEKGDAIAAWAASPANSPIRAKAAHYDGTSNKWGTETFIDQCTACMSNVGILPRVALDSSGNAEVVWAQGQSGGQIAEFAARYGAQAGTWDNAQQLDTGLMTNLNASDTRLVVDAMGNATAVWVNVSNDKTHPNTIITARMVGGSWKAANPVDTTMPAVDTRPAIAVDDQGDVMVAWDNQATLWATELPAGATTWPTDTQLDPQDTSANAPSVAIMHGCPIAVIAFQNGSGQSGGNGTGIYALSFR
jgi:hypothetical protein